MEVEILRLAGCRFPHTDGTAFNLLLDVLQLLAKLSERLGNWRRWNREFFRRISQHFDHRLLPNAGQTIRRERTHVYNHGLRSQFGPDLCDSLLGG